MSSDLVKCVRKYRGLDDKLKQLNQEAQQLREERKLLELELSDILKTTQYATIHKLEIKDDNTVIKIQRPDMWSKPWSLSAKDLKEYLGQFWSSSKPKNAEECYAFVVDKRKNALIATEFAFTRTALKETENASTAN
jgi:predicted nuclease with TOPRIM domain